MLHNITYTEVLNFFLNGFFFFKFYCFSIESNALLILHFFTDQFLWSSICLQYRFQFRVHFSLWLAPQCDCFLFEGARLWYRFYLSWFWCWYPVFFFFFRIAECNRPNRAIQKRDRSLMVSLILFPHIIIVTHTEVLTLSDHAPIFDHNLQIN